MKTSLLAFFSFVAIQAHANNFLGTNCIVVRNHQVSLDDEAVLHLAGGTVTGLSCENVQAMFGAAEAVKLVIMPASMALMAPGVRAELLLQMTELGVTFANPAVLGVTVLGALGYVTVYLVLKADLKACQDAKTRELIRLEVEQRLKILSPKEIQVRE